MSNALPTQQLVHKSIADNVFVSAPVRCSVDEFRTPASFPVAHPTYNDSAAGLSASGYLIEVARQANLAICHAFFDVPMDAGFVVASIDWQFSGARPFVVEELAPFDVMTRVVATSQRRGALARIETRSSFIGPRGEFLSGGAAFLVVSRRPTVQAEPRPAQRAPQPLPLSVRELQLFKPTNALLSVPLVDAASGQERTQMIVDTAHAYFFEHENAHVPGMMLLEAAKQAAVYWARRCLGGLEGTYGDLHTGEIRFGRFAEVDRPIFVDVQVGSRTEADGACQVPVTVSFEQSGREVGQVKGAVSFSDGAAAGARSAILDAWAAGTSPESWRRRVAP